MKKELFIIVATLLLFNACTTVKYYSQSVTGHLKVWSKRQDIEDLIRSEKTKPKLKKRLKLVTEIRQFAVNELGLPDNYSFRSYVNIKRDSIVYNVVAAPEFSVAPKKWCFPVLGCLSYKGYFDKRDAIVLAKKLKAKGYDVVVQGVTAYSTLGWFSDPVLNTFVMREEGELAGLIFHELAHQVIYLKGDTTFNESFATAVELAGIRKWMVAKGTPKIANKYAVNKAYEAKFIKFAMRYRQKLKALYAMPLSKSAMRLRKKKTIALMRKEYRVLTIQWGGYREFDQWMKQDINNALLATLATYYSHVDAFGNLLARHNVRMEDFYIAVKHIGGMEKRQRDMVLDKLRVK